MDDSALEQHSSRGGLHLCSPNKIVLQFWPRCQRVCGHTEAFICHKLRAIPKTMLHAYVIGRLLQKIHREGNLMQDIYQAQHGDNKMSKRSYNKDRTEIGNIYDKKKSLLALIAAPYLGMFSPLRH